MTSAKSRENDRRAERLAAALKANLKRRKAQARGRETEPRSEAAGKAPREAAPARPAEEENR